MGTSLPRQLVECYICGESRGRLIVLRRLPSSKFECRPYRALCRKVTVVPRTVQSEAHGGPTFHRPSMEVCPPAGSCFVPPR